MRLHRCSAVAGLLILAAASAAAAQQNFLPGFAGLKDASQAPPGIYAALVGWGSTSNTVVDNSGNSHTLSNGSLDIYLGGVAVSIVTKWKLLGANYGASILVPGLNTRTEIPALNVNKNGGFGLTSTYIQPINLGWHTPRADFILGYAVYLPTGSWSFNGCCNYGLGMFTQEISAGTTFYFTKSQSVHLAAELVYDINSYKKDTSYRQSFPLTLQGGLGMNYGNPAKLFSGWFGAAGFAQWTMVPTKYILPLGTINGRYPQLAGLGPEFVTLQGALTLRYLWEFSAKSSLLSQIWYIQFAMPI